MTPARWRYLLRTSRPRFWLYLAGPVLVGAVYGAESLADLRSVRTVALVAYFLVPANVLLYGVNDVFDADADAENPKKADREVRYAGDRLVPAAVVASAVLGGLLLTTLPAVAGAAFAAFLALALGYSAPPVRFKARPFLDSLSNGLYVLPGVVAYAALAGSLPPLPALVGGWLWTMGMHTFSAIPDIEADRRAGIRTTATVLGTRRTYWYCGLCFLAAAGVFGVLHPGLAVALGVYPVVVAAIARSDVAVTRAYWWFPAINTVVGGVLTLGGLQGVVHG
ncbi:MAG: prenyltransferase [Haloferacaceae archaeon]